MDTGDARWEESYLPRFLPLCSPILLLAVLLVLAFVGVGCFRIN